VQQYVNLQLSANAHVGITPFPVDLFENTLAPASVGASSSIVGNGQRVGITALFTSFTFTQRRILPSFSLVTTDGTRRLFQRDRPEMGYFRSISLKIIWRRLALARVRPLLVRITDSHKDGCCLATTRLDIHVDDSIRSMMSSRSICNNSVEIASRSTIGGRQNFRCSGVILGSTYGVWRKPLSLPNSLETLEICRATLLLYILALPEY